MLLGCDWYASYWLWLKVRWFSCDAALSVGVHWLNTGMQYASEQLLKSKGYDKQASNMKLQANCGTDLLINSLMFGGARYLGQDKT
ncbi:hypothetical protein [Acinetobacter baumannii]|uniref:hypothetical protein n=1 Tax=Acinetobacter baumannii TaxID=470 RepID=UPI001D0D0F6B|nr:hypothetical protein [Acinetobacter baumannii]